jgi:hypothetical protein
MLRFLHLEFETALYADKEAIEKELGFSLE